MLNKVASEEKYNEEQVWRQEDAARLLEYVIGREKIQALEDDVVKIGPDRRKPSYCYECNLH